MQTPWPRPGDIDRERDLRRDQVRFFIRKRTPAQLALEVVLGIVALGVVGAALYFVFAG